MSSISSLPANVQSLISQLSPTESAAFTKMLSEDLPEVQALAAAKDSYQAPTATGSSPILQEYQALTPSQQADFTAFMQSVVAGLKASPSAGTGSGTSSLGTSSLTTSDGSISTGSATGDSYQALHDKAVSELSNVSTYAQGLQDWQAANLAWVNGGASGGSTTSLNTSSLSTTTISGDSSSTVSGGSSSTVSGGSSATGGGVTTSGYTMSQYNGRPMVKAMPGMPTPTQDDINKFKSSGMLMHQPEDGQLWTKDAVVKATQQSYPGVPNVPTGAADDANFDKMWAKAAPLMKNPSASGKPGNSDQENQWIKEGIEDESSKTGVPKSVILAQIMQESGGCARIETTNNGVPNPGLMQTHNGSTFDPANPEASIKQMIKDGVEGTWGKAGGGGGLADSIAATGSVWPGLRMYNSGTVDYGDLMNGLGSTPQYVSQMQHKIEDANFIN